MDNKWLVVATLLVFAGCKQDDPQPVNDVGASDLVESDGTVPSDLGVDVGNDMADAGPLQGSRELAPVQEGVSPDGASDIASALAGEARAGRITTEDTGFHGIWSHCKQGDFKLYNDRIELCISNEVSARYETFAGGGLVDVRVVGDETPDVFDLYTGKVGYNAAHPSTVEVVRDGSDGGAAVVRAVGTDMPAAYLVGVAGDSLFSPMQLDVSLEYRLSPGDDFVEILTYITNSNDGARMVQRGDFIAWGDRTDLYRQQVGFRDSTPPFSWMAAYGPGHAYVWTSPDEELTPLISGFGDAPWEITQRRAIVLQSGESVAHYGRMFVGDALDPILRTAREYLGETLPPSRLVTVVDASGAPLPNRRVEVFDGLVSFAGGTTDSEGSVQLTFPDGEHEVEVSGIPGDPGLAETMMFPAGDATLELSTAAVLVFDVTADGSPSPASITLTSAAGTWQGATWGERNRIEIAAGDWTVTIARGPEYDWVTRDVTVAAGEELDVVAALTRTMDTTDWIAGDFHQHMEPSNDSRVWLEDRVLDNASMGVELVVPTDHDNVTNLGPVIEAAGLAGIVATFPGAEISPVVAHTNFYPLKHDTSLPGRGAIPLAVIEDGRPRRHTVPELIAFARAMPSDPVVQYNHTRGGSSLFDYVGFDPEVGPDAVTHPWFSTDFDAMEVSNGDECQQFKDWAGMWNAGVEPAPIGSSDSHSLWADVGSRRTYLWAPGIAVPDMTPERTRDVIKANQVVLGTSVMMNFTDGTLPGDTIDGSSGTVELGVRVQSAGWVGVDAIRVIVNGVETELIPVTSVDQTLDFDGTISVPITRDSWVVFLASGAATGTYRPSGKKPYSFNSAVRVDFDGGGYTAPGVQPLGLDDITLCQ